MSRQKVLLVWLFVVGCLVHPTAAWSQSSPPDFSDTVEFLNGSKMRGKVTQIRKELKQFDFETKVGAQTFKRTYPFRKVHAVTLKGTRHELTPKNPQALDRLGGDRATAKIDSGAPVTRTRSEVNSLIALAGTRPPEWLASTPLKHPDSLDLSWPKKPPTKGWNNKKNMGQYIWDVINPNPPRWRSGIKLVHDSMTLHENDPTLLKRDMEVLGGMYFRFLQDYPRAAYWRQRAGAKSSSRADIKLAECYWRMGNKQMALEMLKKRSLPVGAIKLLGDLGQTDRAVRFANAFRDGNAKYQAYLLAGDALRNAGKHQQAIGFYEKVANASGFKNKDQENRITQRARESIEAIKLFDSADISRLDDGTYTAETTGYNGMVNVEVVVSGGRMESVKVTKHREKQFYAALTDTPKQIIRKQSVNGIDAVSGATITSQAIINATAKALAATNP